MFIYLHIFVISYVSFLFVFDKFFTNDCSCYYATELAKCSEVFRRPSLELGVKMFFHQVQTKSQPQYCTSLETTHLLRIKSD